MQTNDVDGYMLLQQNTFDLNIIVSRNHVIRHSKYRYMLLQQNTFDLNTF